jgi:hypothetical protein
MSSHPPLRIAILECDIPIGNTRAKYGGYGNLFKELLLKGKDELLRDGGKDARKEGVEVEVPELDVTKWNVVDDELYPKLEEVDVVLVSGSRESFHFLTSFFFFLEWVVSTGSPLRFNQNISIERVDILVRALAKDFRHGIHQVSTPLTTISGSSNSSILLRKSSLSRKGSG